MALTLRKNRKIAGLALVLQFPKVTDPTELLGWHRFMATPAGSANCPNQPGTEQ